MKNHPNAIHRLIAGITGFLGRQGAFIICAMLLLSLPCLIPVHDGVTFTLPRFAVAFTQSLCIATALAIVADLVQKKWLSHTLIGILAFLYAFNSGVAISQEMHFDPRTLRLILQSNPGEATEFLDTYLFKWSTLGLLVTTALILLLYTFMPTRRWAGRLTSTGKVVTSAIFTVCEALSVTALLTLSIRPTPQYAYTTLQQDIYAIARQESHSETIAMLRRSNEAATIDTVTSATTKIVLVIGESHSRLHSQVYGYPVPDMPKMAEALRDSQIVRFDSVMSRHAVTFEVIPEMYSLHNPTDPTDWRDYPMVQALFRKAGYRVNLFDNQGTRSRLPEIVDFDVNYFLNDDEIERQCLTYRNDTIFGYDGQLVDFALRECPPSVPGPELTIYHLTGQHLKAEKRYPAELGVFSPDDYDKSRLSQKQRAEIAHYDNATLYLDTVLDKIFRGYSGEDAIVLYMPDHGEEIHDFRNFYGRKAEYPTGQARECLLHIPMIVYASPYFRDKHPQTWQSVIAAQSKPWCNSLVAHQLLALAGVSTPWLDQELLLFEVYQASN